jgi:hypothetical protein
MIGRNSRDSNNKWDASNSREAVAQIEATKGTPVEAGGNMKEQDTAETRATVITPFSTGTQTHQPYITCKESVKNGGKKLKNNIKLLKGRSPSD